jgi:hypothetical protein
MVIRGFSEVGEAETKRGTTTKIVVRKKRIFLGRAKLS